MKGGPQVMQSEHVNELVSRISSCSWLALPFHMTDSRTLCPSSVPHGISGARGVELLLCIEWNLLCEVFLGD